MKPVMNRQCHVTSPYRKGGLCYDEGGSDQIDSVNKVGEEYDLLLPFLHLVGLVTCLQVNHSSDEIYIYIY